MNTNLIITILVNVMTLCCHSSVLWRSFSMVARVFQEYNLHSVIIFTCDEEIVTSVPFREQMQRLDVQFSIQLLSKRLNAFGAKHPRPREGIIVEANCPQVSDLIRDANENRMFTASSHWVFVEEPSSLGGSAAACNQRLQSLEAAADLFANAEIFVNSQVFLYQTACSRLYDVYRIGKTFPTNFTLVSGPPHFRLSAMNELLPTGRRRRNLQRILFQCSIVILFPQYFTYMTDFRKTSFDSFSKWSFPIAKLLCEDLNFRYNCSLVNSFGWDVNGTGEFNGLVGRLQRKENDFGMSGLLMRIDRIPACDYTGETIQVRSPLIFRKPSLSSISNIFVLPFDVDVWVSSVAMCLLIGTFIFFQLWLQNRLSVVDRNVSKLADIVTFISGAMCQQGTSMNPDTVSLRITFLLVFMAAIFLFTSYSANIVALLQTPSTSIKTLNDLIDSPIVVGAHNSTYNIVFLKESQSPSVQRLYEKKILPRGDKGFITPDEGLDLVRAGMYAFQIDSGYAYDYISATFTEQEKCGLDEIEAIQLPLQTIPVQKHFPYRDLFTQRLRWQREVGLIDRVRKSLVPQRPKCESSRVGFVSVGLTEFKPALHVIGYGVLVTVLLFVAESVVGRCHRWGGEIKRKFSKKIY